MLQWIEIQMKDETEAFTSANSDKDLKRKREDNESNEELASLFDESNEDAFLENINEKALEKEKLLPSSNDRSSKVNPSVNNGEHIFSKLIIS